RVELGPEVQQEQRARSGKRPHHALDEDQARLVEPVQVLHEYHGGLPAIVDQPLHDTEQATLARFGIPAWDRMPRGGHPQKVEQERNIVGELLVEEEHGPGDLPARLLVAVPFADAEVRAHDLEDREERNDLAMGRPVGLVDADTAGPAALDELVAEAAL